MKTRVLQGVIMAKINETTNCVIGEGSVFSGRFYVNGSIMIEGIFQGDIKTNDELIVGPTGKVKTDIHARRVTIAGIMIGNITATEEVNLVKTGKVLGDISTPKLNVEHGVITDGKVTITSGNTVSGVKRLIENDFGVDTEQLFADLDKDIKKESVKEKEKEKDTAS